MFGEIFDLERINGWFYNIYYVVVTNLLYLLSNIPFLLFLIFVGAEQIKDYLPLFFITLLPAIPALSAMFYSLSRLLQRREASPLKDYCKGYRIHFKQAVTLGSIHIIFLFMILTSLIYFTSNIVIFPLIVILDLIFLILLLITPSLYYIITKYKMNNLLAFKMGMALTLGNPLVTLGNAAAFFVMLIIYELLPVAVLFFLFSLYCMLVILMNRKTVSEKAEG